MDNDKLIIHLAYEWWHSHRPAHWTLQDHVHHPHAGLHNKADMALAGEIAKRIVKPEEGKTWRQLELPFEKNEREVAEDGS